MTHRSLETWVAGMDSEPEADQALGVVRREYEELLAGMAEGFSKVGANVPVFVLEYLLGKYCTSSDEMAIQMGLQVVNDTLAENYTRLA
jgi:predicted ATP-dependent Lon-type protease